MLREHEDSLSALFAAISPPTKKASAPVTEVSLASFSAWLEGTGAMRRQRLRNPAPWICPLPERYLLAFEVGLSHEQVSACFHAALATRAGAPPPPPPPAAQRNSPAAAAAAAAASAALPAQADTAWLRLEEFGEALVRLADVAWSA